jgi:hypothetical protein
MVYIEIWAQLRLENMLQYWYFTAYFICNQDYYILCV